MNVRLLRKIKKHILAEPRRFIMSDIDRYGKPGEATGLGGRYPKCGTAACIAGWTGILCGLPSNQIYFDKPAELLGLSSVQAEKLFDPYCWPMKFVGGTKDDGRKATAKIAAKRIDHFIATKGAE